MVHVGKRSTVTLAEDLTIEFSQKARLKQDDAMISAFIVLAYTCGWSYARTGRYVGLSRQRIDQKIIKYRGYLDKHDMPVLAKLLDRPIGNPSLAHTAVGFEREAWKSPSFATGMLTYIEAEALKVVA